MEDTAFYITTVHNLSGLSIAEEFVSKLKDYFGEGHINSRVAVATLESLKPTHSPSIEISRLLNDATVVIPNIRSSDTPRVRARSVD